MEDPSSIDGHHMAQGHTNQVVLDTGAVLLLADSVDGLVKQPLLSPVHPATMPSHSDLAVDKSSHSLHLLHLLLHSLTMQLPVDTMTPRELHPICSEAERQCRNHGVLQPRLHHSSRRQLTRSWMTTSCWT